MAMLGLTACSPFASTPADLERAELRLIPGVPHRAQQAADDCGPAALASMLAFRGREVPVADIAAAVYTPALGGSLLPDLENYARRLGFATRSGRGEQALLRQSIDAGQPVLIPIETGFSVYSRPHYLVVFGYDPKRYLAHAGSAGTVFIAAADLLPRWERMGRLYLILD
jgi:ABC-type bacteriocin/lantibiotic exporter with double-glycine peptidase domain